MSDAQDPGAPDPVMDRAEAAVDQLAERIGDLTARLGLGVRKAVARAREEADDMWAEAQSIRRGKSQQ